jgi:hypothetical protein
MGGGMTLPTDFDSFAMGFDLTAANYSTPGSGGGTFANLVAGQEAWTAGSNVPSFITKSGSGWSIEGMDFNNSINDLIQGRMRVLGECTILAICEVDSNGVTNHVCGGLNSAANTWAVRTAGTGSGRMTASGFSDDATTTNQISSTTPFVLTGSISPMNETIYAQVNANSPATDASMASFNPSWTPHWQAAIGAHRTSYMQGWIARVLIFSRALHYRDNTNLQSLITTEMAKVGL